MPAFDSALQNDVHNNRQNCRVCCVQERLVAMGGKLVTLKEQAGEAPNGTSFMITTGPTPELDATNLIVGKVSSCMMQV
jgi:cyclophilin family peptidyl-prolyl cis-trans isomerase